MGAGASVQYPSRYQRQQSRHHLRERWEAAPQDVRAQPSSLAWLGSAEDPTELNQDYCQVD